MIKQNILITCILACLFLSCSKDEEQLPVPKIKFENKVDYITQTIDVALSLHAIIEQGQQITHTWWLNNKVVSSKADLVYTFVEPGLHTLKYEASNAQGRVEYLWTINVLRPLLPASNCYVSKLFEYEPAPGQFINKSPGNLESAEGLVGKKGMLTLGAWGGYVVYGFDHTVLNKPDTADIILYNNAMDLFAEPGIVWVMQDENANGLPDDTWYELAGSQFGTKEYIRNYSVTYFKPALLTDDIAWKDSRDSTGFVKRNNFHKQAYYPESKGSSYTLKGSYLVGKVDRTNPSYIKSMPYEWGYADNKSGGDLLDIANAVNSKGEKINLMGIDFIKVQTAVMADMGWLGELSTEILGIADISLVK